MQDKATKPAVRLERTSVPGIYHKGNRYIVVFRDPTGRQRKRSAATLAEARELKAVLTADIARGEYRALSRVTFAEYAREWIVSYQGRTSRGFRDSTRGEYARDLGLDPKTYEPLKPARGATAFFGQMRLAEIEPRDIKRYAVHHSDRGLAPASVRLELAPVRAMLATAVEEGIIRSNPAAGLRITKRAEAELEESERIKSLTEDELRALLERLPADWRLFVEFLAHTGLRIGEAIALTWGDIDFGRRRVTVCRRYYQGSFAPPKSRYGRRDVPLADGMARRLWEFRKATLAADSAPLFPSKTGGVLDASNVFSRVLKPAARAAGVPWAGFHTLRHTCATILFRRGLNAKQVQVWLGHHSPAFTLATYVHLLADDLPNPGFLDELTAPPSHELDDDDDAAASGAPTLASSVGDSLNRM